MQCLQSLGLVPIGRSVVGTGFEHSAWSLKNRPAAVAVVFSDRSQLAKLLRAFGIPNGKEI